MTTNEIWTLVIAGSTAVFVGGTFIHGIIKHFVDRRKKPNIKIEIASIHDGNSKGTYLKFTNIGQKKAYNINYTMNDKNVPWQIANHPILPFEYLNPDEHFKFPVAIAGSFRTRKCTVSWQNSKGKEYLKETILSS